VSHPLKESAAHLDQNGVNALEANPAHADGAQCRKHGQPVSESPHTVTSWNVTTPAKPLHPTEINEVEEEKDNQVDLETIALQAHNVNSLHGGALQ
jgi:hypothetical protein